ATTTRHEDQEGGAHSVRLTFEKQGPNNWNLTASMDASDGTISDNLVEGIRFNDNGSLQQVVGTGLGNRDLVFAFDGVTDPHNLGACLRVADAAGAQAVIAPKDRSASLNATAIKVASGAADTVPYVTVTNLSRALRQMQDAGVWIIGAAGEAEQDLYAVDQTGPIAWVLGAEGDGLRRLTRDTCDVLARIPMYGSVDSLNVSVASGICLFEAARQRRA
ncbi:MAG TPA: 23S rRNA (guanosine(2251)-2'-O)-methyltransferase RlmB, partial [Denitromonas sp.]|nr:23S rRNA (guanosine(2251)-2'-O)-methyltransferase RlmB [Denitromonas sp.]